MNETIDRVILENLFFNEQYCRKAIPFLRSDYFHEREFSLVFDEFSTYLNEYNTLPTPSELTIELKQRRGIGQGDFEGAVDLLATISKRNEAPSYEWLIQKTETFCKDKAIYNTIASAAEILDTDSVHSEMGAITTALENALSITFDDTIGVEYDQLDDRWERLRNRKVSKIKFSTQAFNDATSGGMSLKTLSVVVAGTGVGKSIFMCDQAAYSYLNGESVLYITMEMSEDDIAERIDANVMHLDLDDVRLLSKQEYTKRLSKKLEGCKGRLIVKEYPTACAGVNEFRALLNDLKLKKDFKPTLILIDYINICNSSRYIGNSNANSYTVVKAIAEELRGLAISYNCAILSGTQLNREGIGNSDVSLKEISESSGLSFTVDFLVALMRTEELDAMNQVLVKQLKNRFGDMTRKLRFALGLDRAKMKFFDVENSNMDGGRGSDDVPDDDGDAPWSGNFGGSKRKPTGRFGGLKV